MIIINHSTRLPADRGEWNRRNGKKHKKQKRLAGGAVTETKRKRRRGISPMVEMNVVVNASSENLNNMHVLPTPESPISNSLNSKSYVFLAMVVAAEERLRGSRDRGGQVRVRGGRRPGQVDCRAAETVTRSGAIRRTRAMTRGETNTVFDCNCRNGFRYCRAGKNDNRQTTTT